MANTPRPTKVGGNINFRDEVTAGNIHIKAVEVDADFNTIYNTVNGNLIDENINPAANIATSKLAQDQGIQTGHLADGAVTGAKILDGTITDVDLAPDSVTTAKILDGSVTLAKMAPGSTVRHGEQVSDVAVTVSTTETTILTHPTFTPSGPTAVIAVTVTVNGFASFTLTGNAQNMLVQINIALKRNTVQIEGASARIFLPVGTIDNTEIPFSINLTALVAFSAGAEDFIVTAEKVEAGTGAVIITLSSVRSMLVEHA